MKITKIVVLILFPFVLWAQNDTTKNLPIYEVTSQRLNRFTIGQNHIDIDIDSFTLKTVKNQTLADFLQNNTPLSIKAYGTGLSTVSMRGTGSSHTAIVWNGFSIQNALNGLVDLPLNEMGSFGQVGVKFGGGSALYGSGAIGGAIYLDSDIAEKRGFHGRFGLTQGSFGLFGEQMQISTGTKKMVAGFRLSHQSAKNNFLYKNISAIGQPLQRVENAAFEKFNLNGSLFFNINTQNTLKIHIWDSRNDRQLAPTMTSSNDKARLQDANNRVAVEYTHLQTANSTKVRVAFFDEDNVYNSNSIKNSRNRAKTMIGEIDHLIDFKGEKTVRFGANMTHNKALSNNFDDTFTRTRLAAFSSYNFNFIKTEFNINARQELVDSKFVPFTFSIGFQKNMLENSKLKTLNSKQGAILRGSFSRNYNLPALNDLYWSKLGNPNLKAENGFSGEIGADYSVHQQKISLTFFAMNTNDWIQWSPQSDGIWRPSNLTRVFSRGIEAFYTLKLDKKVVKYTFNAHYQLARSTDANQKQLLYTPIHTGGATLRALYKNYFLQYSQNMSSKRFATTDNTSWTNGFMLSNILIGNTLQFKKSYLDCQLRLSNLFNTDYQVIPFYANPRRQYAAEVLFRF